jgi:DNA helicase-2/ATP-dependent DNA helicase PcrA
VEEGLFPHTRSFVSTAAMEEERRLCYVGMTRAEKRLYLTWARFRRRFGGGHPEAAIPSRFLREVPQELTEKLHPDRGRPQVDLFSEQHEVRETAKRNLYTGKTYNSIENIGQFFTERGLPVPKPSMAPQPQPAKPAPPPPRAPASSGPKKPLGPGSAIRHPKYGRGTILRREGEGEDAKLTVSFPGYGLKKLVEKYAGIKEE